MDKFLRNKLRLRITQKTGKVNPLQALAYWVTSLTLLVGVWCGTLSPLHAATRPTFHFQPAIYTGALNLSAATNAATPNFDPFNMDLSGTILDTAHKHVSCYPNPAISYINFKFDKTVPKDAKLYVFSFTGRQMTQLSLTSQVIKVPLDNYYRGLYVYQLRSAGGRILESGKFQVKH